MSLTKVVHRTINNALLLFTPYMLQFMCHKNLPVLLLRNIIEMIETLSLFTDCGVPSFIAFVLARHAWVVVGEGGNC